MFFFGSRSYLCLSTGSRLYLNIQNIFGKLFLEATCRRIPVQFQNIEGLKRRCQFKFRVVKSFSGKCIQKREKLLKEFEMYVTMENLVVPKLSALKCLSKITFSFE